MRKHLANQYRSGHMNEAKALVAALVKIDSVAARRGLIEILDGMPAKPTWSVSRKKEVMSALASVGSPEATSALVRCLAKGGKYERDISLGHLETLGWTPTDVPAKVSLAFIQDGGKDLFGGDRAVHVADDS
jgi:HEAT repeat protein